MTQEIETGDIPAPVRSHTRDQIVQAAHRLFIENGYHGASMRQIAEEAGIAVGGIYNHFASKEEVYLAVFLEHHPYLVVIPAMQEAQGDTLEETLHDAARRMVSALHNRLDFLNLMFIEMVEFKGLHVPQLFQVIYPQVLQFAQKFTHGPEELRSIPLPVMVRAFVGLFFSYAITELLIADQIPFDMQENALESFVDIYLHGILASGNSTLEEV